MGALFSRVPTDSGILADGGGAVVCLESCHSRSVGGQTQEQGLVDGRLIGRSLGT